MFLRITAALMLLLVPFYAGGVLSPTDHYEQKDAESDISILKSVITRNPGDLAILKRLIDLTFTLEYFDQTEKYCSQYLAISKNSETAYLKIISAASLGKFKEAADQIDPFISIYKSSLSKNDIALLKYRETVYRKSNGTAAYPSGALKTSWGDNLVIKTAIPRDRIIAVYDYNLHSHKFLKFEGNATPRVSDCPVYLEGLAEDSINSISLSDDGREVLVSVYSGDSSSIYTRSYMADKKRWSSWEKPRKLNPGIWNHYPNFVNRNTVIFSSSDGDNYDIYIAQKDKDGDWCAAEKLDGINTPLDEISVSVHPDGETIHFSSNGYEGMGGFDIYGARLKRKGNSFEVSNITNIVSANTFRNEKYPLYLTISGDAAYYNFTAGKKHNIYSCSKTPFKPVPVFYYNADVTEEATGKPVTKADAEYKSSDGTFTDSRPLHSDGFTAAILRKNTKYTLSLSADGYEPFSRTISFTGNDDTLNDKIMLRKKIIKSAAAYTTLITAIKVINCEESLSVPLHEMLEKRMGVQGNNTNPGKNILSFTTCGNADCALSGGKALKADFVVFGTLTKTKQSGMKALGETGEDQYLVKKVTGNMYTLELKLLDINTGKQVALHKKGTGNPDTLKNIVAEFIRKTENVYKNDR